MQHEDLKTLLTSKSVNETVQLIAVSIAVAFVLFQIPSCSKAESISEDTQLAAVKIAAIEAGLVQKVITRKGTNRVDVIWSKPDTEVPDE